MNSEVWRARSMDFSPPERSTHTPGNLILVLPRLPSWEKRSQRGCSAYKPEFHYSAVSFFPTAAIDPNVSLGQFSKQKIKNKKRRKSCCLILQPCAAAVEPVLCSFGKKKIQKKSRVCIINSSHKLFKNVITVRLRANKEAIEKTSEKEASEKEAIEKAAWGGFFGGGLNTKLLCSIKLQHVMVLSACKISFFFLALEYCCSCFW